MRVGLRNFRSFMRLQRGEGCPDRVPVASATRASRRSFDIAAKMMESSN